MLYQNGLSRLGFGCMRLPADYKKSEKLILEALELGVNYFDVAYIYPGKEELLGKIISANDIRDRMMIATKIPHYLVKTSGDFDRIFDEQLVRLNTDHIDYYLMHMLPDVTAWQRLVDLGAIEWLATKKNSGAIRHVGFSYHGGTGDFIDLIDAYPWEFAQVQYNYVDENSQAGRDGVEYAAAKDIPIIIMEPLRGGLLVDKLPSAATRLIESRSEKRTPAEWGLRWLFDQESVHVVLSGMNDEKMLVENARIASQAPAGCLTESDKDFFGELANTIRQSQKIGCTGCSYCMPCPFGVNIPGCFSAYNSSYNDGYFHGAKFYLMTTAFQTEPSYASKCRHCGRCMTHCPQSIKIPDELERAKRRLEFPGFFLVRRFIERKMLRSH